MPERGIMPPAQLPAGQWSDEEELGNQLDRYQTGSEYEWTKQSFVQDVRAKYPEYNDMADDELFGRLTRKYPEYLPDIDPATYDRRILTGPRILKPRREPNILSLTGQAAAGYAKEAPGDFMRGLRGIKSSVDQWLEERKARKFMKGLGAAERPEPILSGQAGMERFLETIAPMETRTNLPRLMQGPLVTEEQARLWKKPEPEPYRPPELRQWTEPGPMEAAQAPKGVSGLKGVWHGIMHKMTGPTGPFELIPWKAGMGAVYQKRVRDAKQRLSRPAPDEYYAKIANRALEDYWGQRGVPNPVEQFGADRQTLVESLASALLEKDQTMLREEKRRQQEEEGFTIAERGGQGMVDLFRYVIEFVLTKNPALVGKLALANAVSKVPPPVRKSILFKAGYEVGKVMSGALTRLPAFTPTIVEDYFSREAAKYDLTQDAQGELIAALNDTKADSALENLWKATLNTYLEIAGEESGELMSMAAKRLTPVKIKGLKVAILDAWLKRHPQQSPRHFAKRFLLGKAPEFQWHGPILEMMEEDVTGSLQALFRTQDVNLSEEDAKNAFKRMWAGIPSMDDRAAMGISFIVPQILGFGVQQADYTRRKRKASSSLDVLERLLTPAAGGEQAGVPAEEKAPQEPGAEPVPEPGTPGTPSAAAEPLSQTVEEQASAKAGFQLETGSRVWLITAANGKPYTTPRKASVHKVVDAEHVIIHRKGKYETVEISRIQEPAARAALRRRAQFLAGLSREERAQVKAADKELKELLESTPYFVPGEAIHESEGQPTAREQAIVRSQYLKQARQQAAEILGLEGDWENPVDRAKMLPKLKEWMASPEGRKAMDSDEGARQLWEIKRGGHEEINEVDLEHGDLVWLNGEWHKVNKTEDTVTKLEDGSTIELESFDMFQAAGVLGKGDPGYEAAQAEYASQERAGGEQKPEKVAPGQAPAQPLEAYRKAYRAVVEAGDSDVKLNPALFGVTPAEAQEIEMAVEGEEDADLEPEHEGPDIEGAGQDQFEAADAQELLAAGYRAYLGWQPGQGPFESKEDIIANMRASLELFPTMKEGISDEQILDAAQDAYEAREAIRAKQKVAGDPEASQRLEGNAADLFGQQPAGERPEDVLERLSWFHPTGPEAATGTTKARWQVIEYTYRMAQAAERAFPGTPLKDIMLVCVYAKPYVGSKSEPVDLFFVTRAGMAEAQKEIDRQYPRASYTQAISPRVVPYNPKKGEPGYAAWKGGRRPGKMGRAQFASELQHLPEEKIRDMLGPQQPGSSVDREKLIETALHVLYPYHDWPDIPDYPATPQGTPTEKALRFGHEYMGDAEAQEEMLRRAEWFRWKARALLARKESTAGGYAAVWGQLWAEALDGAEGKPLHEGLDYDTVEIETARGTPDEWSKDKKASQDTGGMRGTVEGAGEETGVPPQAAGEEIGPTKDSLLHELDELRNEAFKLGLTDLQDKIRRDYALYQKHAEPDNLADLKNLADTVDRYAKQIEEKRAGDLLGQKPAKPPEKVAPGQAPAQPLEEGEGRLSYLEKEAEAELRKLLGLEGEQGAEAKYAVETELWGAKPESKSAAWYTLKNASELALPPASGSAEILASREGKRMARVYLERVERGELTAEDALSEWMQKTGGKLTRFLNKQQGRKSAGEQADMFAPRPAQQTLFEKGEPVEFDFDATGAALYPAVGPYLDALEMLSTTVDTIKLGDGTELESTFVRRSDAKPLKLGTKTLRDLANRIYDEMIEHNAQLDADPSEYELTYYAEDAIPWVDRDGRLRMSDDAEHNQGFLLRLGKVQPALARSIAAAQFEPVPTAEQIAAAREAREQRGRKYAVDKSKAVGVKSGQNEKPAYAVPAEAGRVGEPGSSAALGEAADYTRGEQSESGQSTRAGQGQERGDLLPGRRWKRELTQTAEEVLGSDTFGPTEKAVFKGLRIDTKFGATPSFKEAETYLATLGINLIPVQGNYVPWLACIRHNTVFMRQSWHRPLVLARHEVFHSLVNADNVLAGELIGGINREGTAFRQFSDNLDKCRDDLGVGALGDEGNVEELAADLFAGKRTVELGTTRQRIDLAEAWADPRSAFDLVEKMDRGLEAEAVGRLKYAVDPGADLVEMAARVVVAARDGKPSERALTERILANKFPPEVYRDRLGPVMDQIQEAVERLTKTRELEYIHGIRKGALGEEGEKGQQGVEPGESAAGRGTAVSSTTGGAGLVRRGDIRIAGQRDLPQPRDHVSAGAYDIDEDQRLGVNLAIERFANGGRGFLLADGAGVGKTSQILVTAHEWKQRSGKPVLIVTQNEQVIKGSFLDDAERLGLDISGFELGTYTSITKNKILTGIQRGKKAERLSIEGRQYGLVIFDEAHNLKNLNSQKTTQGLKFLHQADHVIYATATPMDRPTGSVYFLGEITGIPRKRIADMLGFSLKEDVDPDTGHTVLAAHLNKGMNWPLVLRNLVNLRNAAVKEGAIIRREYPFLGGFEQVEVTVPPAALDYERRIMDYFEAVADRLPPNSNARRNFAGQMTLCTRHWMEAQKIDAIMERLKESLDEGRKVVVVSSFVNPSSRMDRPPPKESHGGQLREDWKAGLWDRHVGESRPFAGVLEEVAKVLEAEGIPFARIYGGGKKDVEIAKFQTGGAEVALMTPESGGTGVNLDDALGDKPRDMIMATAIFGGDVFEQALGRISRRNTRTESRVFFLDVSGSYGDERARQIREQKVNVLKRIQEGEDIDVATFKPGEKKTRGGGMAELAAPAGAAEGWSTGGQRGQPEEAAPMPIEQDRQPAALVFEMPEIVQLAKGLLKGRYPKIMRKIRAMHGTALGMFRGRGEGEIELKAGIFDPVLEERKQELEQQARDLAKQHGGSPKRIYRRLLREEYEKPENWTALAAAKTLSHEAGHLIDFLPDKDLARGNILGRLKSVKEYARKTLATTPNTGEDYLEPETRRRLRRQAEKELGKKASREAINARYQELVQQEIESRGMVTYEEIMAELKAVSQWWKPFDEKEDPNYTRYRWRPEELYADAWSVLLNNPRALSLRAPKFWAAFHSWLVKKPEVYEQYHQALNDMRSGKARADVSKAIRDGFGKADQARAKALDDGRFTLAMVLDGLKSWFIDPHQYVIDRVKRVGEDDLPDMKNPRYPIEDMLYSGGQHELMIKDFNRRVLKVLAQANLSFDDYGEYLTLQRIINERQGIANPQGIDPKRARERLAEMRKDWGADKMEALERARQEHWALRQEHVLDLMAELNRFDQETMELLRDNEHYATFNVVEYMDGKYGSGVGPGIYRQYGTLKDIENPGTATLLKDMSLVAAAYRAEAVHSICAFFQEYFPDEIQKAKVRWTGKRQEPIPPNDSNLGMLTYLRGGKIQAYYVPKRVALAFSQEPAGEIRLIAEALKLLQAGFFRKVFVEARPGFWMFNVLRDFSKLYRGTQGISLPRTALEWIKALKPAFQSVFGDANDTVREMLKRNMLISVVNPMGMTKEDTQIERLLAQHGLGPPTGSERRTKPIRAFIAGRLGGAWKWWTDIGRAMERVPKIAAFRYMSKRDELSPQAIEHDVRVQAGSPAFLRQGALCPIYGNLYLFSNPAKEGWRSEVELMKKRPGEWAWKMMVGAIIPKILQWLMRAGIIMGGVKLLVKPVGREDDGERMEVTLKELMENISEYDLANYHCIPLGMTVEGKTVYLRIPLDENSRIIGGIMWKLMSHQEGEIVQNVLDYASGQAPNLNPMIKIGMTVWARARGQNPYDDFRGRPMLDETVNTADDHRAWAEIGKRAWNDAGGGIVYRFNAEDPQQVKTELEKVLGMPVLNDTLGRFVKVSDYGVREKIREAKQEVRKGRAREILDARELSDAWSVDGARDMRDVAAKISAGQIGQLTDKDLETIAKRYEYMDARLKRTFSGRYGGVWLSELENCQSAEERMAVIKFMLERGSQR